MSKIAEARSRREIETGPHPPNAERHGVWRILAISLVLAAVSLAIVGVVYL